MSNIIDIPEVSEVDERTFMFSYRDGLIVWEKYNENMDPILSWDNQNNIYEFPEN